MSLDTKYRPKTYSDVIGQDKSVNILRNILKSGSKYHQSYLFSGPWGSGKTTLARILARALLCLSPKEGDPCDNCVSCLNMLSGNSPDFIEVDAATNSGKDDVKRILEEIDYSSLSGSRKIYLFDEAHALTKGSLDSLLLPLENTLKGSQDKKLVCIFCTTEPEKMRTTILSRCAPMFVVQPSTVEDIANRLKFVCNQESISFTEDSINIIVQHSDKHIRDALKSLEGIASNGPLTEDSVKSYLRLDNLDNYYELILSLSKDLDKSLNLLESIVNNDSPSNIYSKLIDIFLFSYKIGAGIGKAPSFYTMSKLGEISSSYGKQLLDFSRFLSEKLYNPTKATLTCDLYALSQIARGQGSLGLNNPPIITNLSGKDNKEVLLNPNLSKGVQKLAPSVPITTHVKITQDGVYLNPRAINTNRASSGASKQQTAVKESAEMAANDFKWLLKLKLTELGIHGNRKK